MRGPVLAVDAGNSKTIALVVDEIGRILGRGRGGRGDIYNAASPAAAADAVLAATGSALAEAGLGPEGLAAGAFRLAGVDWPEDEVWWRSTIATRLPGLARVDVANDGFASLRLGRPDGVGLAIAAGTGPAIAARGPAGRQACSGWWVFDSLGGWGLAGGAIRAVCLAWMGLAEPTALTDALIGLFGARDVYDLQHSFTRRNRTRPRDEELAATRVVLDLAGAGDAVASALVTNQASRFVAYAGWVAAQADAVPGPGLPVVLNGSVATSEHAALRTALVAEFAAAHPTAPILVAEAPPIAGCVLDAFALAALPVDERLRSAVVSADHPDTFLDT